MDTQEDLAITGGFNTGRMYSAHGQRIFWSRRPDGWTFINDIDRMIYGWSHIDAEPTPRTILAAYDAGNLDFCLPGQTFRNPSVPEGFDFGPALRI
jgi:hypothetical protein